MRSLYALLFLLSGCASTPYYEIGLEYQLDDYTDYWLQTERSWQCNKNVKFHGELGLKWRDCVGSADCKTGIDHESWLLCGGPFNDRPEVDSNGIKISIEGGK